jgi:hypothetical protein
VSAAPKIESAEAPGADVAKMIAWLRDGASRRITTLKAADLLESLSTRCTVLEGEKASLVRLAKNMQSICDSWRFKAEMNDDRIAEHNKRCVQKCAEMGPHDEATQCPMVYMIEVNK